MSWLFLLVSLWGAWFTFNVYRPISAGPGRSSLSFGAAWLTGELALHHVLWQMLFTAGFIWLGVLSAWPGQVGLAITLLSWVALATLYWRARDAAPVVEAALREGLGADYLSQLLPELREKFSRRTEWWSILRPFLWHLRLHRPLWGVAARGHAEACRETDHENVDRRISRGVREGLAHQPGA